MSKHHFLDKMFLEALNEYHIRAEKIFRKRLRESLQARKWSDHKDVEDMRRAKESYEMQK